MKKNFLIIACATAMTLGLSSCGAIGPVGAIYTATTSPLTATSNKIGPKVGESHCISILGLVALGDGGVQEAANKAGIKKISTIDTKTMSILGVYTKTTTVVTGE